MTLRDDERYKSFYEWLVAICDQDIVERLDGTLGDYEADRVLASFLNDVHSDGHIEIPRWSTVSKNPEINSFEELAEKTEWQIGITSTSGCLRLTLDLFDNEGDATIRALELSERGEKGITLTQLVDTAPVETWQLIDGQWE